MSCPVFILNAFTCVSTHPTWFITSDFSIFSCGTVETYERKEHRVHGILLRDIDPLTEILLMLF